MDERERLAALIRKALAIGAVSYDGDGWYAKDAGLTSEDDDTESIFYSATNALDALIRAGVSPSTGEDRLREAAQAVVDALPDPLRTASDGGPIIDTLTVRSPEIAALRAALTPTGDTPKEPG